jgi:hypothetical protein
MLKLSWSDYYQNPTRPISYIADGMRHSSWQGSECARLRD